jgi:hypothetical protein
MGLGTADWTTGAEHGNAGMGLSAAAMQQRASLLGGGLPDAPPVFSISDDPSLRHDGGAAGGADGLGGLPATTTAAPPLGPYSTFETELGGVRRAARPSVGAAAFDGGGGDGLAAGLAPVAGAEHGQPLYE